MARKDVAASWQDGPASSAALADAAQVAELAAAASTDRLAAIIQAMSDGPTDGEKGEGEHAASSLAAATAIVRESMAKQRGDGDRAVPKLAGVRRRSRSNFAAPSQGNSRLLCSSASAVVAASCISERPMASVSSISEIVCLPAPTEKLGVMGETEHEAEASKSKRLESLRQRLTSLLGRETPSSDSAATASCMTGSASLPAMGSVRVVSHGATQHRQCTAPLLTGFAALPRSHQHATAYGGGSGSAYERLMAPNSTAEPVNSLAAEQMLQQRPAPCADEGTRRSATAVTPGSSRRTSRTIRSDPATLTLFQPQALAHVLTLIPYHYPRSSSRRMRSLSVAKTDSGSFADATSELYYSGNPVRLRADSLRQPAQAGDVGRAAGRTAERRSSPRKEGCDDPAAAGAQAGQGWLGAITAAYVEYEKANSMGAEASSGGGKQSRMVVTGETVPGKVADTASMVRTTLAQQRGALAAARQQAILQQRMAAALEARSAAVGTAGSSASLPTIGSKSGSAIAGQCNPPGNDALRLPTTPGSATPTGVQQHTKRRPAGRHSSRLPVRSIGRASVPALPSSPFAALGSADDDGAQPLDVAMGQHRGRASVRSISVAARAPAAASPFAAPSLQAISEFRTEALSQPDIAGRIRSPDVIMSDGTPASPTSSREPPLETIHSGISELPQSADTKQQPETLDVVNTPSQALAIPSAATRAIEQPGTRAEADMKPPSPVGAASFAAAPMISPFASQKSISPTASGTLISPQGSGFASPFASHLTRFGAFASAELPHLQHASSVAAQVRRTTRPKPLVLNTVAASWPAWGLCVKRDPEPDPDRELDPSRSEDLPLRRSYVGA